MVASYRDYVDVRDRSKSFEGLVAFTSSTVAVRDRARHAAETEDRHAGERQLLPGHGRRASAGACLSTRRGPGSRTRRGRHSRPRFLGAAVRRGPLDPRPHECGSTGSSSPSSASRRPGSRAWIQFIRFEFYAPLMMWPRLIDRSHCPAVSRRAISGASTIKGRLKRGVTLSQAQTELSVIADGSGTGLPGHEPESTHRRAHRAADQDRASSHQLPTCSRCSPCSPGPCCSSRAPTSRDC